MIKKNKIKAELQFATDNPQLVIANAARVSFDKHTDVLREKDERLVRYLFNHAHWSPFEMVNLRFKIEAPLFIVQQLLRHKSMSFNQVSARYVEFKPEFYEFQSWRERPSNIKQGSVESDEINQSYCDGLYSYALNRAYKSYKDLLEEGVCPEQARSVLPHATMTSLILGCNLRSLIHFLQARLDSHAQREAQILAHRMVGSLPIDYKFIIKLMNKKKNEE